MHEGHYRVALETRHFTAFYNKTSCAWMTVSHQQTTPGVIRAMPVSEAYGARHTKVFGNCRWIPSAITQVTIISLAQTCLLFQPSYCRDLRVLPRF